MTGCPRISRRGLSVLALVFLVLPANAGETTAFKLMSQVSEGFVYRCILDQPGMGFEKVSFEQTRPGKLGLMFDICQKTPYYVIGRDRLVVIARKKADCSYVFGCSDSVFYSVEVSHGDGTISAIFNEKLVSSVDKIDVYVNGAKIVAKMADEIGNSFSVEKLMGVPDKIHAELGTSYTSSEVIKIPNETGSVTGLSGTLSANLETSKEKTTSLGFSYEPKEKVKCAIVSFAIRDASGKQTGSQYDLSGASVAPKASLNYKSDPGNTYESLVTIGINLVDRQSQDVPLIP